MASDLYLHYRQQLKEGVTKAEADHIIEAAYNDYMKDRITYIEYGKIYFAAIGITNEMTEETRKANLQHMEE